MAELDTWTVINTSHDAHTLGQWNSVATISNGYLGLKGNLAEDRAGYAPVTLVNGVYDELDMFSQIRASNEERRYLDARYFDTAGKSPAVANLPNPLLIRVFVADREISLTRGEVSNFEQVLDLKTGVYRYGFDFCDGAGHTTRLEMERFAPLRHAHRIYARYRITPLDHDAPIRVHSGISGETFSNTTGERQYRVTEHFAQPAARCWLTAVLPAREHEVRLGVEHSVRSGQLAGDPAGVAEHDNVYTRFTFNAEHEQTIELEHCIVISTSEDIRHGVVINPPAELDAAVELGFDGALDQQRAAWEALWQRSDVQIEGDDPAQLGLRFCLFHLLQAGPRYTDKLSVPVKLLTGEYYQGNTFYDTDTYILPFYTFTQPELARTCLNFRYEGLRHGREIARNLGYRGAKFAWQSGPYGEECLGRWWRFTHTNIHINADVAFALMQYYHATGDETYLAERGIDVLVETARFYASRARHDKHRDRYDLVDVAGPDEGHCESTNNFYTNVMAIQNLRWAAEMLAHLRQHDPAAHAAAVRRLAIREDEPQQWSGVADRLALLFDPQTKVYEQCEGFYKLKPIPSSLLEDRKVWFVTVFPYQALNQPDVLMAMALLPDAFPADVKRANYDFYYEKSMNFSSMSFVINSLMSADVGNLEEAYKGFVITCGEDLDESLTGRRDTYAGLHGTAAGGAWMAAIFGFGGVHIGDEGLSINPRLPAQWSRLRFNLVVGGATLHVDIEREQITLELGRERQVEIPVRVAGETLALKAGDSRTLKF